MKKIFLLTFICFLFGCLEDRYRYFCQNPENWNEERCKPPFCVATQTCPEYFAKPINGKTQDN